MLVLCLPVGMIFEERETETIKECVYTPLDALGGGGGRRVRQSIFDLQGIRSSHRITQPQLSEISVTPGGANRSMEDRRRP